jgi:A/G-specific adenine glycosylase
MQQTRIEQGTPYFLRFIDKFPTVNHLAQADESEVLKVWEGLGYYSRARNMHAAAKDIVDRFGGHFPKTYEDVLSLKGVGPYTAAAIVSFGYGLSHAVVDGNVIRVMSRYFGVVEAIDTAKGKKVIEDLVNKNIPQDAPGAYNQAIMDFGALMCKPRNPLCIECPLSKNCQALNDDMVYALPIKSKKTKVRDRYLHYFFYHKNGQVLINQRQTGDIWSRLFELPLIETQYPFRSRRNPEAIKSFLKLKRLRSLSHRLSHQLLHINIYQLDYLPNSEYFEDTQLEKVEELHKFAFPKPLQKFLSEVVDNL